MDKFLDYLDEHPTIVRRSSTRALKPTERYSPPPEELSQLTAEEMPKTYKTSQKEPKKPRIVIPKTKVFTLDEQTVSSWKLSFETQVEKFYFNENNAEVR